MKVIKIIRKRGAGKTSELIKLSYETGKYILTTNRKRADQIFKQAREMGFAILNPVTVDDFKRTQFRGSFIKNVLVDDAEDVLQELLWPINVDAITITEE